MARKSKQNQELRNFILDNVSGHPSDIVALVAATFNVTRVTAHRYVTRLVAEGLLVAFGRAKGRTYRLLDFENRTFRIPIAQNEREDWLRETQEDVIWRENVEPLLYGLPKNITDLLRHGGTEMINNVLDHSGAKQLEILVQRNAKRIHVQIRDRGVGIFEKIRKECNLDDSRHALLELSKGKLTTDAARHSGEGIFFSSRMFNRFLIDSRGLAFIRRMEDDEGWLFEDAAPDEYFAGTLVDFQLDAQATHTVEETFAKFQDSEDLPGFAKTHVPVRLAKYGDELLVSRSQAKRVLARFERFSEVMLDFAGVPQIGQAFADEIFRVYALQHPEVQIIPIYVDPAVQKMIDHVLWGNRPHNSLGLLRPLISKP